MTIDVHVWSDVVCPWCYVGKRRLEGAIAELGDDVAVQWHSFELDPTRAAANPGEASYAQRLARKYGMPLAQAQQALDRMRDTGREVGIDFVLDGASTTQTFDAHRLLHLAKQHGKQGELKERLFLAHCTEGVNCGDAGELARLADQVGLDADEVAAVLHSDAYAAEVRADEEAARQMQVTGVPFFVIGGYGVPGAQPSDTLLRVLQRAREEALQEGSGQLHTDGGATCGPDGDC